MYTISQVEDHLVGMGHGSTLNKIRNKYAMHERAGNNMRTKIDVITAIRTASLTQAVHDDVYNYAVPSDYGKIIDLYPSGERSNSDFSRRVSSVTFDLLKKLHDKRISVESENGTRFLRINWDKNSPKTLANMNSTSGWSVVGSATGLELDTLYAISGGKSLKFNIVASGDGLQNTLLTSLDLSEWENEAEFFMWVYFPSVSAVTSITARWGNDVSTNYFESTAQTTQADGTAFQAGWNLVKFSWASATETGSVTTTAIDSFRAIVTTTGALAGVRFDNVMVSIGSIFDIKYYSAYLFKNSAGTWIRRPTTDSDSVLVDELGLNIYLYECLVAMAQQMEGEDSTFDIGFAQVALNGNPSSPDPMLRTGLYAQYRKEYPSQTKKMSMSYFGLPSLN